MNSIEPFEFTKERIISNTVGASPLAEAFSVPPPRCLGTGRQGQVCCGPRERVRHTKHGLWRRTGPRGAATHAADKHTCCFTLAAESLGSGIPLKLYCKATVFMNAVRNGSKSCPCIHESNSALDQSCVFLKFL